MNARDALEAALRGVAAASPIRACVREILSRPRSSAAVTTLSFVRWAEEQCRRSLAAGVRRELELAQAHLVLWLLARDRLLDRHEGGTDVAPDLLPLLAETHLRFSAVFGPGQPFWADWRRLARQQAQADRWERKVPRPARFGPALVRRLGRKATVARWPAFAVPRLLEVPSEVPRIDAAFDDLLAILQLFDDLADVEDDARSGQINAVLVASGAARRNGSGVADVTRGIAPVFGAIRVRLRLLARVRGGMGAFARPLLDRCDAAEQEALAAAGRSAALAFLERVVGSHFPDCAADSPLDSSRGPITGGPP